MSGHAVEAEDIKASFTRGLTPKNPNSASLGMMDPAQIETPDKTTVVFKLRYPYAPFVKLMASGVYSWILPREALAGSYDPAKTVIGSGPFTFESFTPDVAYVYRKNPELVAAWPPIRRRRTPRDHPRRCPASRAVHQRQPTPAHERPSERPRHGEAAESEGGCDHALGRRRSDELFPARGPASPFQDIRLRRAVSMAIDRAAFGKSLLNNQFEPSFNVPFSLGKWALKFGDLSPDTQQWYKLDLAQAKKLMDAAGGSSLSVKMLDATPHPRDPYFKQAAETFSSMLSALPWKITLVYIDYNKDWVGGGKGSPLWKFPA